MPAKYTPLFGPNHHLSYEIWYAYQRNISYSQTQADTVGFVQIISTQSSHTLQCIPVAYYTASSMGSHKVWNI